MPRKSDSAAKNISKFTQAAYSGRVGEPIAPLPPPRSAAPALGVGCSLARLRLGQAPSCILSSQGGALGGGRHCTVVGKCSDRAAAILVYFALRATAHSAHGGRCQPPARPFGRSADWLAAPADVVDVPRSVVGLHPVPGDGFAVTLHRVRLSSLAPG